MTKATSPDTGKELATVQSVDGTEIAFERTGSGDPLVLVHGGACDHRFWDLSDIRSTFAEHYTVYAMDCRGVGGSGDVQQTRSAEPTRTEGAGDVTEQRSAGQPEASASGDAAAYELEQEFEDVTAVVDSVDEPVVLLGHSYGALWSLEAALRTDDLRALILYEPPIPVGDHEMYQEDELAEMKALLDEGKDEQALVLFLSEVADIPSAQIDALRSAPNWQARVDTARTAYRETQAPDSYHFNPARFERMTTPTLLLTGGESPQWFADAVELVTDVLPASQIIVLKGQEHVAINTAPDLFVETVLAFISEVNS